MSRVKKSRPLDVTPRKHLLIIILFLTGVAIQKCSELFDPQIKYYILLVHVSVSSQDCVICMAGSYGLGVRDSNPGRARDSHFSKTVQTGCGSRLASWSIGTGAVGGMKLTTDLVLMSEVKNDWSCASAVPIRLHDVDRDHFNLYL
jgi:hypothetical protein